MSSSVKTLFVLFLFFFFLVITSSSVRRILKRGARNFRKFERNIDQNLKLSYSNFVPFFAQNQVFLSPKPDAQLAKGGPCLDFAHFSMQFCNPGDPKWGPWPNPPPLNTPLITRTCGQNPFLPRTFFFDAPKLSVWLRA